MSATLNRLKQDLPNALKSGQSLEAGILRMLLAAVHSLEIERRGRGDQSELTEEDIIALLQKEAKKRQESASAFASAGRQELAAQEESELAFIQKYLPAPASPEAIQSVIDEVVASLPAPVNFGAVMKAVTARLKGRADGATVSRLVKERLG